MSQRVAILGAGVSGQAAYRFVESFGHTGVVFDESDERDSGDFFASDLNDFDSIILSPGFSADHPWRMLAEQSSIACYGELGYAARHWKGKIIAVTGTNGKTTLTRLMTEALRAAGRNAVAAGNIGYPFSDAVLSEHNVEDAFAILEVSSFQAELSLGLELDGLIWTNFAEDHLDRYGSMFEYFSAKLNLFKCLCGSGICVIGSQVSNWMGLHVSGSDAYTAVSTNSLLLKSLNTRSPFCQLPQSENFSLLAEFWKRLDLPSAALVETANSFELDPHRLKCEATRSGVSFWDDSKATNFHATLAGISALPDPIFWIGGGQMKGGDVETFAGDVAKQVVAAFVYGEAGGRLAIAFEKFGKKVVLADKFEDAVLAAAEAAEGLAGANVLLSPGFSSFDQFTSYAARGKCFISTVLSLNGAVAAH